MTTSLLTYCETCGNAMLAIEQIDEPGTSSGSLCYSCAAPRASELRPADD